MDALHGNYYACGFDERKNKILPPAYLSEKEVLRLIGEGYVPYSMEELPLSAKGRPSGKPTPSRGWKRAIAALSKDAGNFGELSALYIRKSQAEENRKDV